MTLRVLHIVFNRLNSVILRLLLSFQQNSQALLLLIKYIININNLGGQQ